MIQSMIVLIYMNIQIILIIGVIYMDYVVISTNEKY